MELYLCNADINRPKVLSQLLTQKVSLWEDLRPCLYYGFIKELYGIIDMCVDKINIYFMINNKGVHVSVAGGLRGIKDMRQESRCKGREQ